MNKPEFVPVAITTLYVLLVVVVVSWLFAAVRGRGFLPYSGQQQRLPWQNPGTPVQTPVQGRLPAPQQQPQLAALVN